VNGDLIKLYSSEINKCAPNIGDMQALIDRCNKRAELLVQQATVCTHMGALTCTRMSYRQHITSTTIC
jgi:hypothetical protein